MQSAAGMAQNCHRDLANWSDENHNACSRIGRRGRTVLAVQNGIASLRLGSRGRPRPQAGPVVIPGREPIGDSLKFRLGKDQLLGLRHP